MKRQIFWSIVLTIGLIWLASPIYSGNMQKIYQRNKSNNELRVDIINYGDKNNSVEILEATNLISHNNPQWFSNNRGIGTVIRLSASKKWNNYTIKLKVNNDGELSVNLKGPDNRIDNKRIPIMITYNNFSINNKTFFTKRKSLWHDNSYTQKIKVTKNEIITINFSAQAKKISFNMLKKHSNINLMMLITTTILSFLLSYKLVRYLSKFKIEKSHSRIDIVFLTFFFALLFIPISNISDAERSTRENRLLALKPQLSSVVGEGYNYGEKFEKWFNDRFFGREQLINLHQNINYSLTSNYYISNKGCVNKQTKWIGSCGYNKKMFTNNELKLALNSLKQLINFTNKNKIKPYIIIAPSMGSVYGKNIFPWYKNTYEIARVEQMIKFIKENLNFELIFPYKEILSASKNEYMFFRTDTHWTDSGAFIAYQNVMSQIKQDFPDVIINKEQDFNFTYSNKVKVKQDSGFHNGRNYNIMGLTDNSFFKYDYKYFNHHDAKLLTLNSVSNGKEFYIKRNFFYPKGQYNMTLFGDSFGENLEPIIPFSFKNTLRIYSWVPSSDLLATNMNIQRFEQQILDNKTDILIIILSEIDRLMYLYKD